MQLIEQRQGLRRRPVRRGDPRAPRHPDRARARRAPTATAPSRRTSTCSGACAPASSPTARACCGPRSTWPRGNINLRDPVLYRILHAHHHRTGDAWCIYPTYDFAHGQSDAIEGITHSLCTLEFEDHRPLYDWFLDNLPVPSRPRQIEFARLNLTYTVMSQAQAAAAGARRATSSGWDDPRMPTLSGLRRRGYPPEAIRDLLPTRIGVAKRDSVVDIALLEHCVRDDPQPHRRRGAWRCCRPLKVVIENYPEGEIEELEAVNNPEDPAAGTPQGALLPRALHRARRLHGGPAEEVLPPRARAARCGCATPTSSPATRWSRTPRARSSSCAAPTTRPPAAATRPTAARSRRPSTGSRPPTRSTAEVRALRPPVQPPRPGRRRRTSSTTSTPTRSRC